MNKTSSTEVDGIGRRIAKYRRFCGFSTASDLAEAIQNPRITPATIANIESGRRADVSVMQLLEIAGALGISPTLLMSDVFRPGGSPEIRGVTKGVASVSNYKLQGWLALDPVTVGPQSEASREIAQLVASFKSFTSRIHKISDLTDELEGLARNGLKDSPQYQRKMHEFQSNLYACEGAYLKLKDHELIDLTWFDSSIFGLIDNEFQFELPEDADEGVR